MWQYEKTKLRPQFYCQSPLAGTRRYETAMYKFASGNTPNSGKQVSTEGIVLTVMLSLVIYSYLRQRFRHSFKQTWVKDLIVLRGRRSAKSELGKLGQSSLGKYYLF